MNFRKILSAVVLVSFFSSGVQAVDKDETLEVAKAQMKSVQEQLDDLVDVGGEYAYKQLTLKNHFSPFAVGINDAKQIVVLEIPKTETKASFSDKILKLRQMLKLSADKKKITAAALFVQAKVPHQGIEVPGVAIEMEHKLGVSVLRFAPYDLDLKSQEIKFRQPVDKDKPVTFFKRPSSK